MDPFLLIILMVYITIQCIDNLVDFVNLKHLARYGHTVPSGFEGHLSEKELAGMQAYALAQGKFGFFSGAFRICLTLLFFFGPLLNWYNSWVTDLGFAPVLSGVLFFLILSLVDSVSRIPFDLYHTFVIEEKFGFNTQTPGLWLADFFKAMLVSLLLYGLLLTGVFWLIHDFPERWWLFTWLLFTCFSICMLFLSPYVIEPLFNTFTVLDDPALENRLRDIMARAGIAVSKIFKMDASRRSRHGNAYFSGIGKVKRIVLFDTLLEKSTPEEVAGILAHEAGHWKKHHVLKRIVMMEGVAFGVCYLAFQATRGDWLASPFGVVQPTIYAKLLICGFLFSLAGFFVAPLSNAWSRRHERQADAFAVALTGDAASMAAALVRLGRDNLANLHPHPLYAALHYSHPPLTERVAALQKMAGSTNQ